MCRLDRTSKGKCIAPSIFLPVIFFDGQVQKMNMMTNLTMRGMVFNESGKAKTTSYAVADAFGKRHSDVLKAIKNMKCSSDFTKRNFALCFEISKLQNGKPLKFYQMTERGFMFLVMGFNGEKADAIKESFIDAFEWMAEQLTQITQSKWARYNQVSLDHKTRKQQVSFSARDMRAWRDDKVIFENELDQLEMELQPQLQCLN